MYVVLLADRHLDIEIRVTESRKKAFDWAEEFKNEFPSFEPYWPEEDETKANGKAPFYTVSCGEEGDYVFVVVCITLRYM